MAAACNRCNSHKMLRQQDTEIERVRETERDRESLFCYSVIVIAPETCNFGSFVKQNLPNLRSCVECKVHDCNNQKKKDF